MRHEYFILKYISVSDEAKGNSDLYATVKKIQELIPYILGVYINVAVFAAANAKVHLKLRILISAFFTLYNLKFFQNKAGRLTIEVYSSYKNLTIAPFIPANICASPVFQNEVVKGPSWVNKNMEVANFGKEGEKLMIALYKHSNVMILIVVLISLKSDQRHIS